MAGSGVTSPVPESARGTGEILGARVLVDGEGVGHVTAALVDPETERILGLEVHGADGGRLFLPWVAASVRGDGGLDAASWLVLFEPADVDAYARRGARIVRDVEELARLRTPAEGRRVSPGVATGTNGS